MSPVYSYRHSAPDSSCPAGDEFEWTQPAVDWPLVRCPNCGGPVERLLAAVALKPRKLDCELKDLGFTKLKRVDDGVFENLTRRPGEEKYIDRRRPETWPDLSKTVKD